jgi:transposase
VKGLQRAEAAVPYARRETSTFLAGLRQDWLVAPCILEGAINGEIFLAYVEQMLVPKLSPDDIVIMDNLSSYKVAGVRQAIEAAGAKLCRLLAYSPDLNPIAQAFAKLKSRAASPRGVNDRCSLECPLRCRRMVPT